LAKVDSFPFAAALFEMFDFCLAHVFLDELRCSRIWECVFGMSGGEGFLRWLKLTKELVVTSESTSVSCDLLCSSL
jgi:hypothetical protein